VRTNDEGPNKLSRISVRKRYAPLIELARLANADPSTVRNFAVQIRGGWTVYGGPNPGAARRIATYAREVLRTLATHYEPTDSAPERGPEFAVPSISLPPAAAPSIYVYRDGTMRGSEDFVLKVLLPALEGRDIKRIRLCPICDAVFIAIRVDQAACSPKCANIRRIREFRKDQPRYDRNRRRYRKLGIKAKQLIGLSSALREGEKVGKGKNR
jgi:hypothetical protein